MVGQVRTLGTLMVCHGIALLLFALFGAFAAFVLWIGPGDVGWDQLGPWLRDEFLSGQSSEPPRSFLILLYGVLCVQYTGLGVLSLLAGYLQRGFRGYWLGIFSFLAGFSTLFGFCCLPFSVGLALYGAIVYLDQDVRDGWKMAKQGARYEAIMAHYGVETPQPSQSSKF